MEFESPFLHQTIKDFKMINAEEAKNLMHKKLSEKADEFLELYRKYCKEFEQTADRFIKSASEDGSNRTGLRVEYEMFNNEDVRKAKRHALFDLQMKLEESGYTVRFVDVDYIPAYLLEIEW